MNRQEKETCREEAKFRKKCKRAHDNFSPAVLPGWVLKYLLILNRLFELIFPLAMVSWIVLERRVR